MTKIDRPCWIILGILKQGGNAYVGVVEHSWSMGIDAERANLFWSGEARDNIVGAKWNLDGLHDAEHHLQHVRKTRPEYEWTIFDVHQEDILPVVIDWERWDKDNARSDKTLSGVVNKFGARNPRFRMKEETDAKGS